MSHHTTFATPLSPDANAKEAVCLSRTRIARELKLMAFTRLSAHLPVVCRVLCQTVSSRLAATPFADREWNKNYKRTSEEWSQIHSAFVAGDADRCSSFAIQQVVAERYIDLFGTGAAKERFKLRPVKRS